MMPGLWGQRRSALLYLSQISATLSFHFRPVKIQRVEGRFLGFTLCRNSRLEPQSFYTSAHRPNRPAVETLKIKLQLPNS
ncbi:hypothetical protein SUGI_0629100 [Cryptomeria japonica]|nr:hypothetical protein SUGI_0629100 [Cryptomeria japonica]